MNPLPSALRLFWLFPALFLVACSSIQQQSKSAPSAGLRGKRLISMGYVPLTLKKASLDSRYSGEFKVNGQPVNLLIDSGANSTDLDPKLSKELKLQILEDSQVISRGALGRPVTSKIGQGVLSAGPISVLPFPFMLADEELGHTATSRYDGQIGLDALEALGSLVDLLSGHIWLPGKKAPNIKGGRMQPLAQVNGLGFSTLPLRSAKGLQHLILESKWNGRLVTWIVDTGAEVSVLSQTSAEQLGLATRPSKARIIDASGDNAPARAAQFKGLIFDNLVLTEFDVSVIALPSMRKYFTDHNGRIVDGIIGMDFLESTSALLDVSSRLLYVGKPEQSPPPTPTPDFVTHQRESHIGLQWSP